MQGKTETTPRKIFSAFHLDLTMASLSTIMRFFRRAKAPNEDSGLDCHNALPAVARAPSCSWMPESCPQMLGSKYVGLLAV
jgi:hypothetical protein